MTDKTLLRADAADPLWVPLLTHYRPNGSVDLPRMAAHLQSLAPHVRQIMLAGSTGDGWEVDETQFEALLDFAAGDLPVGTRILFGALRPGTDEVIARIARIEDRLSTNPALRDRFCGIVVCPPVDPEADQAQIAAHYAAVLSASTSDIAAYQLPQVTGCRMAPETLDTISAEPRITMFKDSSGEDHVAGSGHSFGGALLVRGAEGGYLDALSPRGPYHGWLLSTGNALAAPLRRILELDREGDASEAGALSAKVSDTVARVFAVAVDEGGANAFSNANRAMDHLRAYGSEWRNSPAALKVSGDSLSETLLERVSDIASGLLNVGLDGYMQQG